MATREPRYFGTSADARVTALAAEASSLSAYPVLDIGAGTGRNAFGADHPVLDYEQQNRPDGVWPPTI